MKTAGTAKVAPPEILVFVHRLAEGGVERVALRLAEAWCHSGARVTLAVAYASSPETPVPQGGWRLMQASMRWWPRSLEGLWMAVWLVRCIAQTRPAVIFCPGNSYTISAVLAKAWLGRSCPPILSKISNSLARTDLTGVARKIEARWLRLQGRVIDRFAAAADPVPAEAIGALNVPADRVSVLPNPVIDRSFIARVDAARAGECRTGQPVFLAIGRLVPQKDFALLLNAFARYRAMRQDGCSRLVILGEGPERARLETLRHRLDLDSSVTLPGHCSDIAAWLNEADYLVSSSRYEGLPGAIVEALAAGVPVISTASTVSLSALIDEARDGLIVPVGDCAALAAAMARIERLVPDPAAMRRRAMRYSLEESSGHYLHSLRELAAAAA